jgi:signal transduction histidine kinase
MRIPYRNPFAKWSIHHLMLLGFGLVFFVVGAISLLVYRNTSFLISNTKHDARSQRLVKGLDDLLALLEEAERSSRRYFVTGDDSYLEAHQTAVELTPAYVLTFQEAVQESPVQQERVLSLETRIKRVIDAERAGIAQRKKHGYQGVRPLVSGRDANRELEGVRLIVSEISRAESATIEHRAHDSAASTHLNIWLLGGGTLLQWVLLSSVYYLIRHDLAERERVARELARRGELLEAANKELEAFSYSVSHDLRAPLRHIDGYVALLDKASGQDLPEKARRYLTTISQAAKQMGQLIDDLLSFSRMGRAEMMTTEVDMNQLVKDVIQHLQPDLQGRAIAWQIEDLPVVQGDPSMLRQIFVNLIANAVKFTGTRPLARIEIGAESSSQQDTVIFVKDNGVGFDMAYRDKLFGVFQRLHRVDEFEGTGIGLANVRRIIHRHGGRSWAEGQPDQGATFYIALPKHRTPLQIAA